MTLTFRCISDRGFWVAQCVEVDLATQARTLDELLFECRRMVDAHFFVCERHGIDPMQPTTPPPVLNGDFASASVIFSLAVQA